MSYPPPPSGDPQDPQQPHGPNPPEPGGHEGESGQHPPYGQPGQYYQPGPYGQPTSYGQYGPPGQYGQYPPPGYGPPPPSGTNIMAILSLVFAFVFAPVGIVLGHVARRQIRQSGEQGAQLATWGLVLSYIFTALYVIVCCGWLALVIWAGSDNTVGSY